MSQKTSAQPGDIVPQTVGVFSGGPGERKIDAKILAVLAGCTLLLAAVVARFVYQNDDYSSWLAMFSAILLGTPIVWGAMKSLITGKCSYDHDHGHHACGHHHSPGEKCEHDHKHNEHPMGGSHMEELVALAILASFVLGEYLECAAVAFFMLIASLIEHRTAVGALKAIEGLIRLTPTKATLLTDKGDQEVSADTLKPGDVVLVRPGDNIPGDGTIRAGASTINEANITGESMPAEKSDGDEVFAGTINQTGRLEVTITRAGQDSTLGKVQSLILQAAQTKPTFVRELSKYTAFYTPVVIMLAGMIYFFTKDPEKSISLLLVACPCALVLCGPTAVVAALSAAARLGVYVKSVADLEVVRRVTAFVFDKTGTLTTGELTVTRMKPAEGVDGAELLMLAAAAEQNSRHPVARAVMAVAKKARINPGKVNDFYETAGRGVSAQYNGSTVRVGREAWLAEQGVNVAELDTSGTEGMSLLFVAKDNRVMGWVGLSDTLRTASIAAIDELGHLGVKQRVMITGDRRSPAERIAQQLHLTGFMAEALPGDKLKLVEQLKQQGHTVAVIGDGVNDGPALAAGHVSLAMGAVGSDVALDAASIALMNNELDRLPFLMKLSRHSVNVIRQNLAFTLGYIVLMLVLLGLGWLTPMWAAIGHGISSIIVIFNSARLVREGEDLHREEVAAAEPAAPSRPLERVPARPTAVPA
jgi:Cd2+/Zn2+-exporting ATPase